MEMLIVLTIIALLMGMVIFQVSDLSGGAKTGKSGQADILTFKEMLAAYELDNGSLPTTEQGIKALWSKPTVEPIPDHWRAQLDQETLDPWGHSYQYLNPGKHNPEKYDVFSMGEDGVSGADDNIGNWPDTKKTSQVEPHEPRPPRNGRPGGEESLVRSALHFPARLHAAGNVNGAFDHRAALRRDDAGDAVGFCRTGRAQGRAPARAPGQDRHDSVRRTASLL